MFLIFPSGSTDQALVSFRAVFVPGNDLLQNPDSFCPISRFQFAERVRRKKEVQGNRIKKNKKGIKRAKKRNALLNP